MYRLNDRLVIYQWLKERNACSFALLVFDENPWLDPDTIYWLCDEYSSRAAEMIEIVLSYVGEAEYLDCCFAFILRLVDHYAVTEGSRDYYNRYFQLRYRSVTPVPRTSDDDLPF